MSIDGRLDTLEKMAGQLPPDSGAAWLTDEELYAIIKAGNPELDVTRLTDEELEAIARGDM